MRKSYNGYYKALPRLRREFDSPLSLKDSSNVECYFVFPTTSPGSNPGFRSNKICGIGVRAAQYLYTQQVFSVLFGGLAHLARAFVWQTKGDRFETVILHNLIRFFIYRHYEKCNYFINFILELFFLFTEDNVLEYSKFG